MPSAVGLLPIVCPCEPHTMLPHRNSRFWPPSHSTSTVPRSSHTLTRETSKTPDWFRIRIRLISGSAARSARTLSFLDAFFCAMTT